jgi:hypothetical protein
MESSKRCPYCAQPNAGAATKCGRCGADLTPEPPPPQGELIRWQYKLLIVVLITGAILLYSAPKNAPATASRPATASTHSAAPSALKRSVEPAQSAVPPDDAGIASVQAISPYAAQKIRSYCAKSVAAETGGDASLKSCEHRQIDAWDRVVLDREFPPHEPTLDRKCSERPFPDDGFVAYEACLRAELKGR